MDHNHLRNLRNLRMIDVVGARQGENARRRRMLEMSRQLAGIESGQLAGALF